MKKGRLIYEGKAKKLFASDDPQQAIIQYKDSLTAFNAQKKGSFPDKGRINKEITTLLFKHLANNGVPSHWVQDLGPTEMLVTAVKIIPLEVVVRNRVAGSLAAKLKLEEGRELAGSVVEFYFKDDALGDPFLSQEQIVALGIEKREVLEALSVMTLKINQILSALFKEIGLELIDFKVEFGRDANNNICLADEITPDCCRLWDLITKEKMDKDRFRRDLGKVEEAYLEVLRRLKGVIQ